MALSDYGAFVYCNGKRREDKEDAALFTTDEKFTENLQKWSALVHGVLGDGRIRVACYKQGLPRIFEWEAGAGEPHEIIFHDNDIDDYEYEPFEYEYKGYCFHFEAGAEEDDKRVSPFMASMTEL